MERGNFALDVLFPTSRSFPATATRQATGDEIRAVHRRLRAGESIASATRPLAADGGMDDSMTAMSNRVEHAEAFNTRYGSYRGWQMAIERVNPIERDLPRLDLTAMVLAAELDSPGAIVDYFAARFLSVPLTAATRTDLAQAFAQALGSTDIQANASTLEEPLRLLLHLVLSRPEYQLG